MMKRFKLFGLGFLTLLALGAMTASASALTLPDMHVTLGGTYPVTAEGTRVSEDRLETISGSKAVGTLVKLTLGLKELSSLGLFTADFTGVKEGANKCKTVGDAEETVLTSGEYHLVPNNANNGVDIVFLPSGFTISCGTKELPEKVKIKVKGVAVGSVTAKLNTELTTFGGVLEGTKGKQNITSYLNDSGATVSKQFLESEFGLGYEQSDEQVTGEITLSVLNGQMIEILP